MSGDVHIKLHEWDKKLPETTDDLRGRELHPRQSAVAEKLAAQGALEITELRHGVRIRTFSWVGRVRLGDLVVTVEPKLKTPDLLSLLRYAYSLRDLRLWSSAPLGTAGQLLQDLLVAQLLAEVRELIDRGLTHRYVATSEELSVPRGRIDLAAVARRGPVTRITLPCRYHLRSSDHHLNRLLLAGVRLAARITEDPLLRGSLWRTAAVLTEEVPTIPITSAALDRAERELDRLSSAYRPALELIRLLHDCSAPSLDDAAAVEVPGFLFDMNRFFQALVHRLLRDHLLESTVQAERPLADAIRFVPGANPKRRPDPAPRPDFTVRAGRRRVLLDAKYRDLWDTQLPRDMLYQLALYAVSQAEPRTAAIIYPADSEQATEAQLEVRIGGGSTATVALRPLHLGEMLRALKSERPGTALERIARRLAFGASEAAAAG